MDTVTYRIPALQRRSFLKWGLGVWIPALVCIALGRSGPALVGAVFFGAIALVTDVTYLNILLGRTVVSAEGIRTWRPLGSGSWTWREIQSVTAEQITYGKGAPIDRVVVRPVHGRPRKLAVPYSTSGLTDVTYRQTAQAIVASWQAQGANRF